VIDVRSKRWRILVLVALALPMMGCFQCAAGQGITQTMVLGSDVACLPIGAGFLCILLALILLPAIGGGMGGGGREG